MAHGWQRYTDDRSLWLDSRKQARLLWEAERRRLLKELAQEHAITMTALLLGTRDPECALHKLAGHEDVLRKIHSRLCHAPVPTALAAEISGMSIECAEPRWLARLRTETNWTSCARWRAETAADGSATWVRRMDATAVAAAKAEAAEAQAAAVEAAKAEAA